MTTDILAAAWCLLITLGSALWVHMEHKALRHAGAKLKQSQFDLAARERAFEMLTEGMRKHGILFHVAIHDKAALLTFTTPPCPQCGKRRAACEVQRE